MKNIFISLCLFISSHLVLGQTEHLKNTVYAEVKFGMYSDCLRRGGICSFDLTEKQKTGNAQFHFSNGMLHMKIAVDNPKIKEAINLKEGQINSGMEWSDFVVVEPIPLDHSLRIALDIHNQALEIPAGSYPVILCENFFIIQFKTVPL